MKKYLCFCSLQHDIMDMGQTFATWRQEIKEGWADLLINAGWATPDLRQAIKIPFDGENFDNDFEQGTMLGEGAFSIVRRARHRESQIEFAVKTVKYEELSKVEFLQMESEISVLKNLSHPNIVKLYSVYREPEQLHMVMELVVGGELFDRIVKKETYNEGEARDLIRILLEAIKFMHMNHVVHRDLKPENLLMLSLNNDYQLKIADFGFATYVKDGPCEEMVGTPLYVAPEVLSRKPYSLPADMWSTGVLFYILLSGRPPFHDAHQQKLYRMIKAGMYQFHPEDWSEISDDAKDLVKRMLTVNPDIRITAQEALQHPWLVGKRERPDLKNRDLSKSLRNLRIFNARRKLQVAIRTVIFFNRMTRTFCKKELTAPISNPCRPALLSPRSPLCLAE